MPDVSQLVRLLLVEHLPITLAVVLGLTAVYLLLPRPRGYPPLWGAAAGGAALLAGWFVIRTGALTPETLLFSIFSALAVVSGTLLITQRNPARAALAFALVVLSTCGLFLLLAAPFLMAATVIVYAGAIVVTFLFVIMLAQQEGLSSADQRSREPLLASLAGFLLLGTVLYALARSYQSPHLNDRLREVQQFQTRIQGLSRETALPDERSKQVVAELEKFLRTFRKGDPQKNIPSARILGGESGGDELADAVYEAQDVLEKQQFNLENNRPVQWDEVEQALAEVRRVGDRVVNRLGTFQPRDQTPLSGLSGPPPNRELRRDAAGRPELPAENVAYLGRSLFTDFLIAVELAGTLLLVATVGAIAIAGRRAEGPP
ncbi:MAG TPA: NADH-quinone oxidoreductase subunit J [Gemmataceae bacterium]|nr:NADH-quinone oxidoreductase subunit J [Gemmataceae bacterium]